MSVRDRMSVISASGPYVTGGAAQITNWLSVFCTQLVDLPAEIPQAESDSDSGVGSPMEEAVTDAAPAEVHAEEGEHRFIDVFGSHSDQNSLSVAYW